MGIPCNNAITILENCGIYTCVPYDVYVCGWMGCVSIKNKYNC